MRKKQRGLRFINEESKDLAVKLLQACVSGGNVNVGLEAATACAFLCARLIGKQEGLDGKDLLAALILKYDEQLKGQDGPALRLIKGDLDG